MTSTASPYVSSAAVPAGPQPLDASTVVAKVAAGILGLAALAISGLGAFFAAADLSDGSDMYDGLGTFIGLVVLACSLPVLGLCVAAVVSRNRVVVAVCSLLVAGVVAPVALLAGSVGGPVSLVGVLAGVLGVAGLWSLVAPARA